MGEYCVQSAHTMQSILTPLTAVMGTSAVNGKGDATTRSVHELLP